MKKYLKIIIGSLLISISFSLFFIPNNIVPNGTYGMSILMNYETGYDPALFLLIVNFMLIVLSLIIQGPVKSKNYVAASLLIPIFIYIINSLSFYTYFVEIEMIMAAIAGAFLTGLGYSFIYKSGESVGGIEIIQDMINNVTKHKNKRLTIIVEIIILILTSLIFDLETMLYSLIVIIIILIMSTKSKIGVSTTKTFFIITNKEKEVKKYILEELKQDLTEFNTKGGFSKTKNKIIMTSVDTTNYYELKEGILLIDPTAFISITDGYEVINKNLTIRKDENI